MYLPNSTWHNMPFAARFVQDHAVGDLLFTEPLKLSVWFYPQNSELLHSAGILFIQNDFLSPLINIGWLAGCLLAAWCLGRPYAVGATALLGVGLILDANMLLLYQPGDAKNDIMGLFFLLASAAILVNAESERRRAAAGPPRTGARRSCRCGSRFGAGAAVRRRARRGARDGDEDQPAGAARGADDRRDRGLGAGRAAAQSLYLGRRPDRSAAASGSCAT